MSTRDERRRKADKITMRLVKRIGSDVGDSVPDKAWQAVAEADAEYMTASARWVETGHDDDLAAFRSAYNALLSAWSKFK